MIPGVAASETGGAQTDLRIGVEGLRDGKSEDSRNRLEAVPKRVQAP